MRICVAPDSGFCKGVSRAIDIALSCKGGCYTLGKLIHNESVLAWLQSQGVVAIDDLDRIEDGKTVVIRSHGVGKSVYDYMDDNGICYLDATCGFVKKIHKIVYRHYNSGYRIVIIGDPAHPEVQGINGWCEYTATILDDERIPPLDPSQKYCVVSQTTFDDRSYRKIVNLLEKCCKTVVIHNTICYTTINRQNQADLLSAECDAMLVIGSKTSSNTRKLYDICRRNCERTYDVEKPLRLRQIDWDGIEGVGIVAGASTPPQTIGQVVEALIRDHGGIMDDMTQTTIGTCPGECSK